MNRDNKKISYPCQWEFTVIGLAEEAIRNAIAELFPAETPEVIPSNQSKTGKYVSFSFSTTVTSEEERNTAFTQLQQHAAIRMVL